MSYQSDDLLDRLIKDGWYLKEKTRPSASNYWWAWEIWELHQRDKIFYITFLVDPQAETKEEKNVWAITATGKEPMEAADRNGEIFIVLNKRWKSNISKFVSDIRSEYLY